mgnify:FL=1
MNVTAGLQRHWNRIDALTLLLLPLSVCYGLIISTRALLYKLGVFRVRHWNVPILVVGNLTVGGSGKTPLVIELARGLRARGWRPGVVSRGYGGISKGPTTVTAATDPFLVGDEPVLIAREAQVPVVVARKRAKAVDRLLQETEVNLVIADDGLQHLALGRVVEIAVIDGVTGHGNGLLLPAGPLREPLRRLERVDIRVRRGGQPKEGEYPMSVNPSLARNLVSGQEVELVEFSGVPLVAVAGIHQPERFFSTLRNLGLEIQEKGFSDHHAFQASDIPQAPERPVLMTAKDAVKCEPFAQENWWAVKQVVTIPQELLSNLDNLLERRIHGS